MWRSRGGGGQGGPFPQKYLNSQRKLSVKKKICTCQPKMLNRTKLPIKIVFLAIHAVVTAKLIKSHFNSKVSFITVSFKWSYKLIR